MSVTNLACRGPGLLASTAIVLTLASCTGGQQPPLRTDVVQRATITAGVSATGALSAVSTENLGFPKGGKLTSVRVRVGDHISAGQVLATVDDYADRQVLKQQKANLAAQKTALARIEQNPSVSGAQDTVDQANTIVSATKDQVAATQTADNAAIHRARRQLADDEDAKDQASDAISALNKACKSAKAGSQCPNWRSHATGSPAVALSVSSWSPPMRRPTEATSAEPVLARRRDRFADVSCNVVLFEDSRDFTGNRAQRLDRPVWYWRCLAFERGHRYVLADSNLH